MTQRGRPQVALLLWLLAPAGCAPTVNVAGVYFPGWLVSTVTGVVVSYGVLLWLGRRPAARELAALARDAEETLDVVAGILDHQDVRCGQTTVQRRQTDLVELLQGATDSLMPRARAAGVVLEVEHGYALPRSIETDPDRLRRLIKAVVQEITRQHSTINAERGFGWDLSPEGRPRGLSDRTYYHTGWTGQSIWIDPESELYVIVLTNRNHPTERSSLYDAARRFRIRSLLLPARTWLQQCTAQCRREESLEPPRSGTG